MKNANHIPFVANGMGTYEISRSHNKNGIFSGVFMLLKGALGLGIIVNQYYQAKAGLVLGPLATVVMSAATVYSMHIILSLANRVELEMNHNYTIETMDQLVNRILGPTARIVTKILIFTLNQAAIIINIINLSKFLQNKITALNPRSLFATLPLIKLLVIMLFLVLVSVIIQPERLRYPAYIAVLIVIFSLLYMWILNISYTISNDIPKELEYANISNLANLVGSLLYSFKSVGIIFGVRATLKHRYQINKILYITYGLVIVLFSINGMSFLIVI